MLYSIHIPQNTEEEERLLRACRVGDLSLVKKLYNQHTKDACDDSFVNQRTKDARDNWLYPGFSPLHCAAL